MLSLSHAPTGAFIASKLIHPALIIPIAISFHFLQDWIPHWDVGVGFRNHKHKKALTFLFGLLDLFAALFVVYWWWQAGQSQIQWHIWLGAVCCILPDLLDAPENFLGIKLPFVDQISRFHEWIHESTSAWLLGISPQVIVLIAIYFLK